MWNASWPPRTSRSSLRPCGKSHPSSRSSTMYTVLTTMIRREKWRSVRGSRRYTILSGQSTRRLTAFSKRAMRRESSTLIHYIRQRPCPDRTNTMTLIGRSCAWKAFLSFSSTCVSVIKTSDALTSSCSIGRNFGKDFPIFAFSQICIADLWPQSTCNRWRRRLSTDPVEI